MSDRTRIDFNLQQSITVLSVLKFAASGKCICQAAFISITYFAKLPVLMSLHSRFGLNLLPTARAYECKIYLGRSSTCHT